jgi:hypothetical protein
MGVGGQLHAPAALPPGKRSGTHCVGDWVGPRAGLMYVHTYLFIYLFVVYLMMPSVTQTV